MAFKRVFGLLISPTCIIPTMCFGGALFTRVDWTCIPLTIVQTLISNGCNITAILQMTKFLIRLEVFFKAGKEFLPAE